MSVRDELSPTERRVIIASVIMLLLTSLTLVDPRISDWLFDGWGQADDRAPIGRIALAENDVRQKDGGRYAWRAVPATTKVADGDSIFTGEKSTATVELSNSLNLRIDPQSLVRFRVYKGEQATELNAGSLRIDGVGEANLVVNGQLVKVPLNGEPLIARMDPAKGFELLSARDLRPVALGRPSAVPRFPPVPLPESGEIAHWGLYDWYERREESLARKVAAPTTVRAKIRLNWRDQNGGPYEVDLARDRNFDEIFRRDPASSTSFERETSLPMTGFYWRVRKKKELWSESQFFRPRVEFRPEAPRWREISREMPFFATTVSQTMTWTPAFTDGATLVEVSSRREFPATETAVHFTKDSAFTMSFDAAGTYYVRLIGVDANQRLGSFSSVETIRVETPPLLGAARLPGVPLRFQEGKTAHLTWKSPRGASFSKLEVYDHAGRVILSKTLTEGEFGMERLPAGTYSYRITPVDRWDRDGRKSAKKTFEVNAPMMAEIPRQPAQEAVNQVTASTPTSLIPERMNDRYSSSSLAVEGASFLMFSSEQQMQKTAVPTAGMVGLRWRHWWETLGLEWSYRGKVVSLNESAKDLAPSAIEGRIEARTTLGWSWFSFLREMQIAGVVGAESYRNPGHAGLYSSGYDLLKTGLRLDFPVASRWDSGGEVLWGRGSDSSSKFEVSGFMNYYLNRRWTLGAGYRAHGFTAGSEKSAPVDLPYREAYGEAFSTLRYLY